MKILAIDIGGTAIKYGITDENFNVCEFMKYRPRQNSAEIILC